MRTRGPVGAGFGVGSLRVRGRRPFQGLQRTGRGLRLPIAVLPAAGILDRLGQPDVFGDEGLGRTDVSRVRAGRCWTVRRGCPCRSAWVWPSAW
ncbi:PTS system, N-acetylglucosamine-specific IIC component [Streptomyces prasinopilosus]|uniref:PTS system, N-acetylglucosamine-specific IIC component n=1 Tax=Streptomyces prasinopilosus TaxID=67344 RepID=A0A1G6I6E7_9ACTN|nr:PTS system, N-acetylglucosamine-specific IIC component [Streptomyces prasinopilosus]